MKSSLQLKSSKPNKGELEENQGEASDVVNPILILTEIHREIIVRDESVLPSIDALERLEKLVPNSASRIIDDYLNNNREKREIEQVSIKDDKKIVKLGLYFAFIFAETALIIPFLLSLYFGYPILAAGSFFSSVAAVVFAFLYDRRKHQHPVHIQSEKNRQLPSRPKK